MIERKFAMTNLQTMGQQHGRRSWAEPWKIKMVEPIKMTTAETYTLLAMTHSNSKKTENPTLKPGFHWLMPDL